MCGICGIAGAGPPPAEVERLVREMASRLEHRGPDDAGFYVDRHVALGARRLSIIDIPGGHQPIGSEDGSVQVVFNGEIYDHARLRRTLQAGGHVFRSVSDTEVLVHAYEERGPAFLEELNGIFAIALWDAARRRLLLARDPVGAKPLYWCEWRGRLAFASEIKALLALPGISREVDEEALELYLAYRFVPSPWTLFRGVRKLPPGHRLLWDGDAAPRVERFEPPPGPVAGDRSGRERAAAVAGELRRAVRRQRAADVPVGVLLSGGADSAALLSLAGGESLHAYTVGFQDAPEFDEIEAAADTARRLGAVHRHVRVADGDFRRRLVEATFWMDEPVATPSVAPYDALCRLAARERKVVLSGQGADEPFAGYGRHLAERVGGGVRGKLLALASRVASSLRPGSEGLERAAASLAVQQDARRYAAILALFPEEARRRLRPRPGPDPAEVLRERIAPALHLDPLARFLYLDTRFGLADDLLLYADKVSMAHSLEVRVPFLDRELLRLVESIPGPARMPLLRRKRLLHRSLAGILPAEILARPKRNFAAPARAWMQEIDDRLPSLAWILGPGAAIASYCSPTEIRRLRDEQAAGRDRRRQLFALLAFEVWHRVHIDGRLAAPVGGGTAE